jgi:hypothetical protein
MQILSTLNGSGASFATPADDTLATAMAPFQAFDCSALGFKPRVELRLKGGTTRGKNPSLRVIVRPWPGDANIAAASVALPPSIFLDQSHLKTICTRAQFASDSCPEGSIYGRVRAYTPLLSAPMAGPVYLRASANTLPDLVFALKGDGFEIDLAGKIDSFKGGIRGTFPVIPDAPVTKFELRMDGGKRGLLQDAADLCAGPQLATARLLGHAGRGWVFHPTVKTRCPAHRKKSPREHKGRQG